MNLIDEAQRIAWEARVKMAQKEEKKRKFRQRVESVGNWITRNAPTILVLAPVAIAAVNTATNLVVGVGRRMEVAEEKDRREHSCYDRSEGHYWDLKRKLTNSDWEEINERKANGERMGDILDDMDVLK